MGPMRIMDTWSDCACIMKLWACMHHEALGVRFFLGEAF